MVLLSTASARASRLISVKALIKQPHSHASLVTVPQLWHLVPQSNCKLHVEGIDSKCEMYKQLSYIIDLSLITIDVALAYYAALTKQISE